MRDTLITSSILIIGVIAVRAVFRNRISARARYAMWLAVALCLLVSPFVSIESPFSIANLWNDESSAGTVITLIYCTGASTVALCFIIGNALVYARLVKKRVKYEVPGYDRRVYLVDDGIVPCTLWGAVYISPYDTVDGKRLKYVLTHELMHNRHLDTVWALVRCICLSLYWFNPLVWVASRLAVRDCEAACDESVVRTLGEEARFEYCKMLLSVAAGKSGFKMLCIAETLREDKRSMKKRQDMCLARRALKIVI